MATKHDVYPGDMGRELEAEADRLGTSLSGLYKEGVRRMAQDPNHPLDLDGISEKENEGE
jgi:hypothetical protein